MEPDYIPNWIEKWAEDYEYGKKLVPRTYHGSSAYPDKDDQYLQALHDKEEKVEECARVLAKKYGQPDDWEAFVEIVRIVDDYMT